MPQLQPVLWSRGAFLQPQHLQTQDLYLESRLKFLVESVVSYAYGFRSLTIDAAKLAAGTFSVTDASGIFPDGLLFQIPESDREPEPRPLAGAFEEGSDSLLVSLAIPQYTLGVTNVSAEGEKSGSTRFASDWIEVRDETTGLDKKAVQIARKNLKYLLPKDDCTGHSLLPIARILKRGDRYEADRSFVPPVLHTGASPVLTGILRNLTGILSARSQEQALARRGRGQGLIELGGNADTTAFWLHYTVNQHFPVFRNMLGQPSSHPQHLFARMLALAGALTAFRLEIDPLDLPVYNHDDPGPCFEELDRKLRELLQTAIPRFCETVALKSTQHQFVHSAVIAEDRFLVDSRLFVGIRCESDPARVITNQDFKVSSSDKIHDLINSAVSGVEMVRVTQVPGGCPMSMGFQYFQLNQSGVDWNSIVSSRTISAYVSSQVQEPTLELLIVLRNKV